MLVRPFTICILRELNDHPVLTQYGAEVLKAVSESHPNTVAVTATTTTTTTTTTNVNVALTVALHTRSVKSSSP